MFQCGKRFPSTGSRCRTRAWRQTELDVPIWKTVSSNATVIHIDIAQEELVGNRPGSIGIRGDVKQVLRELLGCLEQQQEAQGCLVEINGLNVLGIRAIHKRSIWKRR